MNETYVKKGSLSHKLIIIMSFITCLGLMVLIGML